MRRSAGWVWRILLNSLLKLNLTSTSLFTFLGLIFGSLKQLTKCIDNSFHGISPTYEIDNLWQKKQHRQLNQPTTLYVWQPHLHLIKLWSCCWQTINVKLLCCIIYLWIEKKKKVFYLWVFHISKGKFTHSTPSFCSDWDLRSFASDILGFFCVKKRSLGLHQVSCN